VILLAQESFWKLPSFWDLAGFVIGLSSIWWAWYFAKRDLKERIEGAKAEAREEGRRASSRMGTLQLKANAEEIRHSMERCREMTGVDEYGRAIDHLDDAEMRFLRLTSQQLLRMPKEMTRDQFRDDFRFIRNALQNNKRRRPGRLTDEERERLRDVIGRMIILSTSLEHEISGG